MERWISSAGRGELRISNEPVSTDASRRRYFRAADTSGQTYVVMDSIDDSAGMARYRSIADSMRLAGIHVPEIYAQDETEGFMLISDFGSATYLAAMPYQDPEPLT